MAPRRIRRAALFAAALCLGAPRAALAADDKASPNPQPSGDVVLVEGTVLAIDEAELVVDLGAARGVAVGQKLELWRPLRIRHPVTGQMVLDRFSIGALTLVQVRSKTAIARISGKPLRPPAAGDIVVAELPRPEPPPTPSASPPPPSPPTPAPAPSALPEPPATDVAAAEIEALLQRVARKSPEVRVAAYEEYARAHPESPYTRVLTEDARELRRAALAVAARPPERPVAPPPPVISESAPAEARGRVPLAIALELDARFRGGVLHYRERGARTYRSVPMRAQGPRYFGAAIPAAAVTAPGVDYFVEGVDERGVATPLVGDASSPRAVAVGPDTAREAALGAPKERSFSVSLLTDYASFNLKKDNDTLFQTEGSFTLRLRDVGLRAVRSGAGVYRGKGGTLEELDQKGLAPRDVGLTYGHLEAEVAFAESYSVIGRAIVGLREPGIGVGAQGFFRVGSDRRTNLLVGGELLGGIGLRGIAQLEWRTIPRVPIVLRTEVTNQPAGVSSSASDRPLVAAGQSEVGARTIGQVGYEITRGLVASARVSYQAGPSNTPAREPAQP